MQKGDLDEKIIVLYFGSSNFGAESYLALTGLDLLVSAVKTAPLYASILAVISNFLWFITLLFYRSVKTDNKNKEMK